MVSNTRSTPRIIGESHARPDAPGKLDGSSLYPADCIRANMVHARIVFAHVPRARLHRVDPTPALAIPGVIDVLTAADVPYNRFGLVTEDQPVLCEIGDEVRFAGDKIAVVIGTTPDAAELGARAVATGLEALEPILDPERALEPASDLVHRQLESNLVHSVHIETGDVDSALASADVVITEEFSTTWQEHAFLQPEAGIAWIDDRQRLVIETAGQWLHEDRKQLAKMLQVPEESVVVRYRAIGGAFGGREDLSMQHVLALAAWKLGRPVALQWTREESIIGHHKRHPYRIRATWGAMRDGTIVAARTRLLADGGAYASTSAEVLKISTLMATGSYRIPNITSDGYVVYTNNLPSGAFRGFGAPQAQFAAESMVNRLARHLQMHPAEIRRRNLYREGDLEPTGNVLPPGVSALPVLEAMLEETRKPSPPATPWLQRGFGIASGIKNVGYSFGFPDKSSATVELTGRGEVEHAMVRIGAADVGQGSHLAMRQIAAGALDLSLEQVQLDAESSESTPNAGSASASRLTTLAGRAVHEAALKAKAHYVHSEELTVSATVEFHAPATTALDPETGQGVPNFCYGYAAQSAEVEVNTITGEVRVVRVVSAHDVGKAINRQQVVGQIEGCLAQALGYTLLEHFQMKDGIVQTSHLSTYLLPTILDMPEEMVPIILELADPVGPFGARGVAEMPLVPFAPAIAAAIHDAVGIWLNDLPFTPERVLEALITKHADSSI